MKIQPITKNYEYKPKQQTSQTSFRGLSITVLLLAYREGKQALKDIPKNQLMNCLTEIINNSHNYREEDLRSAYGVIANTDDNYYTLDDATSLAGQFYSSKYAPYLTMPDLRILALAKLPFALRDNNQYNIQAKKDFLRSILANGYEIPNDFHNQFSDLNDNIYSDFKKEIVDTCLYSTSYGRSRKEISQSSSIATLLANYQYPLASGTVFKNNIFTKQLFNNLALVSTLDTNIYNSFIEQKRETINQSKIKIAEFLTSTDKKYRKGLMNFYMRNIKYL